MGAATVLNPGLSAVDIHTMGNVDRRLLGCWEESTRHQAEARRFLARQRFSVPGDEGRTLDEIVATITDLERTRRTGLSCPPPPAAS